MTYSGTRKLGDFFTSRRERGNPGLPTLSVTLNRGLVTRESLDRKMETNLSDEAHLLVRKGDIVYNMMRMWQGASGLADRDGLLSPAYVVLAPKQGIDPSYTSYLFKSPRLIYLFWAYSYGLTSDRLRLYFNDFKNIPVNIPSILEQEKIAKILETWDKAIEKLEKLLENSILQKFALMQKLLTGQIRVSGHHGEWKNYEFSSFTSLSNKKFDPHRSDKSFPCIELEHISQVTGELLGSVNSSLQQSIKNVFAPGDVLFGKLRPYLKKYWLSEMNGVCSTEIWVLQANNSICLSEYLFYLVQNERFIASCHVTSGSKMPRAEWEYVSSTPFPIPSLNEQSAIVDILKASTKVIANLNDDLEKLREEKTALMQKLLTGKRRVKIDEA